MTEPIPFAKPKPAVVMTHYGEDITMDRLVRMVQQTNLIALDKTLTALKYYKKHADRATRVADIRERILRAAHEVRMYLPK